METEVPEIDAEDLHQGQFHMGLETESETHRECLHIVIDAQVAIRPEYRSKQLAAIVDFLEEYAVGIRVVESRMDSQSVNEFPVTMPVHAYFFVFEAEHVDNGSSVAVAELSLVAQISIYIHPEGESAGITSTQTRFHGVELGLGACRYAQE